MRSIARWVLPVLVGPSTATIRDRPSDDASFLAMCSPLSPWPRGHRRRRRLRAFSAGGAVVAVLPPLRRVAANDFREPAVLLVEQGELSLFELREELFPGNLGQRIVLRLQGVGEHDADDADVAALMRTLDRRRLTTLAVSPF